MIWSGQATNLRELDLSGNLLTQLPSSLATLPKLEVGTSSAAQLWATAALEQPLHTAAVRVQG